MNTHVVITGFLVSKFKHSVPLIVLIVRVFFISCEIENRKKTAKLMRTFFSSGSCRWVGIMKRKLPCGKSRDPGQCTKMQGLKVALGLYPLLWGFEGKINFSFDSVCMPCTCPKELLENAHQQTKHLMYASTNSLWISIAVLFLEVQISCSGDCSFKFNTI